MFSRRDDVLYHAGRVAYFDGQLESACPYGHADLIRRGFWLAGWHDADIETNGFGHFARREEDYVEEQPNLCETEGDRPAYSSPAGPGTSSSA
jgi:ribosome modulation factor